MSDFFCGVHGICSSDRKGCRPFTFACACYGLRNHLPCGCGCHELGHEGEWYNDMTVKWIKNELPTKTK